MEYGAGTGIASFLLKDYLSHITMIDNSAEMVRVTTDKIKNSGSDNLSVLQFDLEHNDYRSGRFDLIFTQMVLHHVMDIDTILKRFGDLLNPGGYLAIADLYAEDGSFHGEGFTGHNGFDPGNLAKVLERLNFNDVLHRKCFTVTRNITETESANYDLFLLSAVKQ